MHPYGLRIQRYVQSRPCLQLQLCMFTPSTLGWSGTDHCELWGGGNLPQHSVENPDQTRPCIAQPVTTRSGGVGSEGRSDFRRASLVTQTSRLNTHDPTGASRGVQALQACLRDRDETRGTAVSQQATRLHVPCLIVQILLVVTVMHPQRAALDFSCAGHDRVSSYRPLGDTGEGVTLPKLRKPRSYASAQSLQRLHRHQLRYEVLNN
jgi:hypothetical protein